MSTLVVGDSHVCGFDIHGIVIYGGKNIFGQLNVPYGPTFDFIDLAWGLGHI